MIARRAFSFIELLVVVGILGVLIAILVPALGAAKRIARSARCATQIGQIALAQFGHAADHAEQFIHGTPSHPGIAGPISAWAIWHGTSGPVDTDGWIGVGLLWKLGYLGNLRIAYCPLWIPADLQYESPVWGFHPAPAAAAGHGEEVIWSYHYRSAMDCDDADPRPPHLDEDEPGDPFLCDGFSPLSGPAAGPPTPARELAHGDGYNVAYLDGSVTYLVDRNSVVSDHAPQATEHEEQEGEIWEPYFDKETRFWLGGSGSGTVFDGDLGPAD